MRIIGGKYGRRIIKPPKNLPVRPTTDLAKESLFNILRHKIDFDGKMALDLFAGTGSISYEFVSRGCAEVLSIDQNYKCIQFIKDTMRDFDMKN
ncbi:MAG: 16S rRNA (guanine(966)-N(2))-methyltransferase RsmD, partial [Marinilabiliales bacterium]